jgi:hypothetical protein
MKHDGGIGNQVGHERRIPDVAEADVDTAAPKIFRFARIPNQRANGLPGCNKGIHQVAA